MIQRRGFLGAMAAAVMAVAIEVLPLVKTVVVERPWAPSADLMELTLRHEAKVIMDMLPKIYDRPDRQARRVIFA